MNAYRYSFWDGSQKIDPFSAQDLMDHLSDRILDGRDLWSAMRDMMQRGTRLPSGRQMPGLQDLLNKLRERRQQQLGRYNMDSVMDDIKEKLDQIIQKERSTVERRLSESDGQGEGEKPEQSFQEMLENIARKHLEQLDNLPPQAGGRIQQLRDYDFMDLNARQEFQELLESLQQQVMQQYFQGLKQSLGAMTPEQMKQMQQMVRDLNQLLDEHRKGNDSGFQEFMEKWGDFFPDGIENADQLAQHLAQQMQAVQSLFDSMTPEMRGELNGMMDSLFQSGDFQEDLFDLMWNLDQLYPNNRREKTPFSGDDPITLQEAMRLMGDMNGLDELEKELIEAARNNDPDRIDPDQVGKLVGDEARKMAEELQEFARMLEEAGLVRRNGKEWELTPRAQRKIGERALQDIFGRIEQSVAGDHSLQRQGVGIDRLEDTKPYVFGDSFDVHLQSTVMNGLRRKGPGTPVQLAVDDFEVYRAQSMNQCATVILLDMSYSMLRGGRFIAGRKVAMALDSLIRNKFPRDVLHIAAFSYFVLPLTTQMLLHPNWIEPGGTDFPTALRGARDLLKSYKEGTKQIILITDGEPHASSWGYGYGRYDSGWSMRAAMEETLREVRRCTRNRITVNTFMLDTQPVITTFIKSYTKINKGRIFFADPSQLGEYLIVDYMKNRRSA